jgi:thiol:disulfide interchange protein DsbA
MEVTAMTLARLAVVATALLLPPSLPAQQAIDPEGKYELVQPPQPTETPGKIEIVDVFWYGCPHCYRFLPAMEAYEERRADYVVVRRMPAIFRDSWDIHARAFYTAQLLKVTERVHRPLFEAMHEQGRRLDTRESLREFFVAHGVDAKAFDATFDSFAVETMVRKSHVMQGRYGVRGTPTVIVNGKYRVSASLAGGYDQMVQVAAALAEREHKATMASN